MRVIIISSLLTYLYFHAFIFLHLLCTFIYVFIYLFSFHENYIYSSFSSSFSSCYLPSLPFKKNERLDLHVYNFLFIS